MVINECNPKCDQRWSESSPNRSALHNFVGQPPAGLRMTYGPLRPADASDASRLCSSEVEIGNAKSLASSGMGMPRLPFSKAKFLRITWVFEGTGIDFDNSTRLAGSLSAARENPKTRRAPERRAMDADL